MLSIVLYAGWILGIIGVVLLLRAMKEFSYYYQDEKIYQNSLTGVKFYIIALVAAGVASAALIIGVGSATGLTFAANFVLTVGFGAGLIAFIAGLVVAFVFYVLATSRLRKVFNTLAQKSGGSIAYHSGQFALVGRYTDNYSRWFGADTRRLDICYDRILRYEISTIPTIRFTTRWELSAWPISYTTYNANKYND